MEHLTLMLSENINLLLYNFEVWKNATHSRKNLHSQEAEAGDMRAVRKKHFRSKRIDLYHDGAGGYRWYTITKTVQTMYF